MSERTVKRSVQFQNSVSFHEVPKSTAEDQQAAWLTIDDYEKTENFHSYVMKMLDMGFDHELENDENTLVGLEMVSAEGIRQRDEHRRRCYNAVLNEQQAQTKSKCLDPNKIRQAYERVTKKPSSLAQNRAKLIQRDIREYLEDTRKVNSDTAPLSSSEVQKVRRHFVMKRKIRKMWSHSKTAIMDPVRKKN